MKPERGQKNTPGSGVDPIRPTRRVDHGQPAHPVVVDAEEPRCLRYSHRRGIAAGRRRRPGSIPYLSADDRKRKNIPAFAHSSGSASKWWQLCGHCSDN
jgi:hypothetical protein